MFGEIQDFESNLLLDFDEDCILNSMMIDAHFPQSVTLEDFISEPWPKSETSSFLSEEVELPDASVPLNLLTNRKEWLVEDAMSKRMRSPRLYEFLVLLLQKADLRPYASFSDREKGLFQVYQPEKVAELWQAVKSRQSNQKMTYDKFARAVRWYYKSNIMQKTNTRYTFQFSPRIMKTYFFDENNNDLVTGLKPVGPS